MATSSHPRAGIWNTNSFLTAGIPFITGGVLYDVNFPTNNAEVKVSFPFVTKSITVISRGAADIRLHFASIADDNTVVNNKHYITLEDQKDSITLGVKAKDIYLSLAATGSNGSFEVFAELTTIPRLEMFELTGSGVTG